MISKEKIYYLIGLIGSRSPFFLLIPILSFHFTKSYVGKIDLILVTVILLIPVVTLQLGDAAFRFLKEYTNSKSKIISTAIIGLILNTLLFLIVSCVIFSWLQYEEIIWFIFIFVSSLIVHNLLLIYRGLNFIKSYALLGFLSGTLTLSLILFFISSDTNLLEVSILFSFGHLVAIFISIFVSSIIDLVDISKVNKRLLYILLMYSLPLIPNAISWWFIDLGNRYIIRLALGEDFLGIFAVASRYIVVIAFINNFFLLVWQDNYLNTLFSEKKLKKDFQVFIKIQISIVIFLTSVSYFLIKFGAGADFIESYKYVSPISITLFLSSLSAYAGVDYLKNKNTKLLFYSTLQGGLVNIIIALLLVKFLGLYGIVVGSIFGFSYTLYVRLKNSTKLQELYSPSISLFAIGIFVISTLYAIQLFGSLNFKIYSCILVVFSLVVWNKDLI